MMQHRPLRTGFTLVEVLLSIALVALAGSALLLSTTSALQTHDETLKQTLATGVAEQLMDEILGKKYSDPPESGYQTVLGPSSWETSGACRERYNDIDDYAGLRLKPPKDIYGIPLGSEDGLGATRPSDLRVRNNPMANWQEEVDVYYVQLPDLTKRHADSDPSAFRMVEVRIVDRPPAGRPRTLVTLKRLVGYVSPLP